MVSRARNSIVFENLTARKNKIVIIYRKLMVLLDFRQERKTSDFLATGNFRFHGVFFENFKSSTEINLEVAIVFHH